VNTPNSRVRISVWWQAIKLEATVSIGDTAINSGLWVEIMYPLFCDHLPQPLTGYF